VLAVVAVWQHNVIISLAALMVKGSWQVAVEDAVEPIHGEDAGVLRLRQPASASSRPAMPAWRPMSAYLAPPLVTCPPPCRGRLYVTLGVPSHGPPLQPGAVVVRPAGDPRLGNGAVSTPPELCPPRNGAPAGPGFVRFGHSGPPFASQAAPHRPAPRCAACAAPCSLLRP
jgi:hypothetical protein